MKRRQSKAPANRLAVAQRALWHAALVTCISNLLLAGLAMSIGAPAVIGGVLLAHGLLAASVWAAAAVNRWRSVGWVTTADAALFAPYFATIWVSHVFLGTVAYDPLLASKLLAVGVAAIVPSSYRLHLVLMAGLVVQAAVIWLSLPRNTMVSNAEPWLTAIFFLVNGWFLAARWQQHELEKELEELRIKTRVLTDVAQTFVAVRHLAGTPLQKAALLTSRLQQGAPPTPERLAALQRAVHELEDLLAEFSRYETFVTHPEEEMSFDAKARLASLHPRGG